MNDKTIIGVDPGKEGFITVMRGGAFVHHPIPMVGHRELDMVALSALIVSIASECDPKMTQVVIEDVHAIYGSSAGATFTFGGIAYALRMGFIMVGLPVVLVAPKKWQKEMFEGVKVDSDKKVMSIAAAKRLCPGADLRRTPRCTKPDDNLTDSLLIAIYGSRHYVL